MRRRWSSAACVLQRLTVREAVLPVQELRTGSEIRLRDAGLAEEDCVVLGTLFQANPALRALDARVLSDAGVRALAPGCGQLTAVDFSGSEELTDDAVSALAGACGQLDSASFMSCTMLTEASATLLNDKGVGH